MGESFSDRLKILREQKRWSKAETARKIGVTGGAYSNWEYGNREPSFKLTKKISEVFDVSMTYLLEGKKTINDEVSPETDVRNVDNLIQKIPEWAENQQKNSELENKEILDYTKKIVKFTRKIWETNYFDFAELINSQLKLGKSNGQVNEQKIKDFEAGKDIPNKEVMYAISSLLNVDYNTLIAGNLVKKYSFQSLTSLFKKMGFPNNKEATLNLTKALNETGIMQFGIAEIAQMYSYNLVNDSSIKDKKTMENYWKDNLSALEENNQNESLNEAIRQDIAIESYSIKENLKRLNAFYEVFQNNK